MELQEFLDRADEKEQGILSRAETGSAAEDATQAQIPGLGQRGFETGIEQHSVKHGIQASVHDMVVDVEISSQHAMVNNSQLLLGHQFPDSNGLKQARMAISPWMMEHQRYFTLTFASFADSSPTSTRIQPRGMPQAERQGALSDTSASVLSLPTSALDDHNRDSSTATSNSSTNCGPSIALATNLGKLKMSHIKTPSTILERVNRMKDAMIDLMETPVVAMCHDESLAIANKAAWRLMHQESDSASNAPSDLLTNFKIYTEDFGRELEPGEHPIVRICRSQKPFEKLRVGIIDPKSQRKQFDVRGETIHDQGTGEFLAGIIFMKDVTEYAEIITNQFQAGQQQFQLICDTIPQMVWRVQIDGLPKL